MPFERLARLNKHRNIEVHTCISASLPFVDLTRKTDLLQYTKEPEETEETKEPKPKKAKRLTISKKLTVQAQFILQGENEDHEEYALRGIN